MGDERLRELEHRWAATKDPADEARLLSERLRAGGLERARLELAAYAGHGPAIEALGAGAPIGHYVPWDAWRRCLDAAARPPLVRLVLVHALDDLRRDPDPRPQVQEAVDALRCWLACPCEAHAKSARRAANPLGLQHGRGVGQVHGATAVAFVAQALTRPSDPREKDELRWALTWLVPRDLEPWQELLLALDDLVRWALGPAHTLVYERPGDDLRGYLGARVASGEVSRERLEVAAYAGSAEARALLESPPEQPADTAEWVLGLGRRGLSWALRALALLGSHEAFEEPRWLADPARTRPYDPDSVAMLPPSAYEQMSRAHACQSLRRWADTGREDLRTSIAAVRRHDGAPVRAGAEAALASRATLLDVLATCAAGTPPSHSLIQRVLEARRDRGRRERIERAVVRWALRVESRAGPWRATFSAPGRP